MAREITAYHRNCTGYTWGSNTDVPLRYPQSTRDVDENLISPLASIVSLRLWVTSPRGEASSSGLVQQPS
jgi:hypothetical protein